MWAQAQATQGLREIVSEAGVQPQKFELHAQRVGGAIELPASKVYAPSTQPCCSGMSIGRVHGLREKR